MMLRNFFLIILTAPVFWGTQAATEVVSVNTKNGGGHGFLFGGSSQCYIFLPNHVLGRSSSFTFQTSQAPSSVGQATLLAGSIRSMDLAIAEVSEKAFSGCGTSWQDIVSWKQPQEIVGLDISLRQVPNAGQLKEIPMRIFFKAPDEFDARVSEQIDMNAIQQGASGSIAFYDGGAIGMAVAATDPWQASFLSLNAITQAVSSTLDWSFQPTPVFATDILPSGTSVKQDAAANATANQPVYKYDDSISPTDTAVTEE